MALVEKTVEDKVVRVRLSRPDKLNALSRAMITELTDCFFEVSREISAGTDYRALILESSSPKAFCVGADLSERLAMSEDEVLETLDSLQRMTLAVEGLPIPTIAAIRGAAFGGGLELALCCDLRIAHQEASLGLTETRLAIIPGAGGTQRLTQLVGVAKAKELIFLATRLDAQSALQYGIVNLVTHNPEGEALSWAQELCNRGPLALRAAKAAIGGSAFGNVGGDFLAHERKCYKQVLHSKDRLEGLKAFTEKREPVYQGE